MDWLLLREKMDELGRILLLRAIPGAVFVGCVLSAFKYLTTTR